jgi:small ligand-binding sensory domain FIST
MDFVSAISQHPETEVATGEVIGQLLDGIDQPPGVLFMFVMGNAADRLDEIISAIDKTLRPGILLGATASGVIGINQEVEHGSAISLLSCNMENSLAIEIPAFSNQNTWQDLAATWKSALASAPESIILLADFNFPIENYLNWANENLGEINIFGAVASMKNKFGRSLILGNEAQPGGAVGLLIGSGIRIDSVVSHGCRPVGSPMVVTDADGSLIKTLGGIKAIDKLLELSKDSLSSEDIDLINQGALHIGRLVDETLENPGPGDFLIRPVLGVVPELGAIAVADDIPIGTTVSFQVKDKDFATIELAERIKDKTAQAALVFSCNGRGTSFFDFPHHDASIINAHLGLIPLAGFFAAGEIAKINRRTALHCMSSSIALFHKSG